MALCRDVPFTINQLRTQYLKTVDDDQSHRTMRPYGYGLHDSQFGVLLTRIESPPIPIDVAEESVTVKKLDELAKLAEQSDEDSEAALQSIVGINAATSTDHKPQRDDGQQQVLQRPNGFFDSLRGSLATLKLSDGHAQRRGGGDGDGGSGGDGNGDDGDDTSTDTTPVMNAGVTLHGSSGSTATPLVTNGRNVLSKLFRNSTHVSENDRRPPTKGRNDDDNGGDGRNADPGAVHHYSDSYDDDDNDDETTNDDHDHHDDHDHDHDNDNDNDNDYHHDNDNGDGADHDHDTTAGDHPASATDGVVPTIDTGIELNEHPGTVLSDQGILISQDYSDVNNTQVEHFAPVDADDDAMFHNTVSSGDEDLALDSDFSDDDTEMDDATFQSVTGRSVIFPRTLSARTPTFRPAPSRKLSFDRTKPRMKRRSGSLLQRRHPLQEPTSLQSDLSVESAFAEMPSMVEACFPKVDVEPVHPHASKLTQMVDSTLKRSNKGPLEHFLFVDGEAVSNKSDVVTLKVWLPDKSSFDVKVRRSVRVFDVIGFIIWSLLKSKAPLFQGDADETLRNPNRWCCKLVDEDGEPYEGSFGLMDRTKIIGSYGEDELALCKVSESDFQINQRRTPVPEAGTDALPSPVKNQNNYYRSILPHIDNDVKDAKRVEVQVYQYPYTHSSNDFLKFEFLVTDKLNDILVKYTSVKSLIPTSDYVLKAVGENYVLDLNDSLSSLDENYTLEVLTKRKARELKFPKKRILDTSTLPTVNSNLTPQTLVMRQELPQDAAMATTTAATMATTTTAATVARSARTTLGKHAIGGSFKNRSLLRLSSVADTSIVPNDINSEYHKYTVWRRLPMSFINRHERTLAIDGEYVYIMPNDEKLWYDTNFKTTTFHVSQIMSCKVSKRVPSNFKIVVMKANGPKRYVFEALNNAEAKEIIGKLKTLMEAYKINTSSVV